MLRPTPLLVVTVSALVGAGLSPAAMGAPAADAAAPALELVSVAGPAVPVLDTTREASLSGDGRYVAFTSGNRTLPADANHYNDVYRHDRLTGETVLVSVAVTGGASDWASYNPSISADGNLIAFTSSGSDLVPEDTNSRHDVFVRDVAAGTTTRVSLVDGGGQSTGGGSDPSLSADGTTVAFTSRADDLVPLDAADTDGVEDVFVHVLATMVTERVSVPTGVAEASGSSTRSALNRDGTKVVFRSDTALTGDDANAAADVFHRDRSTGTTVLVGPAAALLLFSDNGRPAISGDGRTVAFESSADTLVPEDTNGRIDVFLRDVQTGTTTRASVSGAGQQVAGVSLNPALDETGNVVVFQSSAPDVVAGDTNGASDVFRRDMTAGTTERVSALADGTSANGSSVNPAVSGDGAVVAFESSASNHSPADLNGPLTDVFVRAGGTTAPLGIVRDDSDLQTPFNSSSPDITPDGRWVAFVSKGGDLAPGAPYDGRDRVYLRDRLKSTTELVSVGEGGVATDGYSQDPSVSADGRYVAFFSLASNLVPGDTNGVEDVFVRDLRTQTTRRVSVSSTGTQGNGHSFWATLSDDGSRVAFTTMATDLVTGDGNGVRDVLVHDLRTGTTQLVSRTAGDVQGNGDSVRPSLSADGNRVAFTSTSTNLAAGDVNGADDVFVRDLAAGTLEHVSVGDDETPAALRSSGASLSADGTRVAFHSGNPFVPRDSNAVVDVFVRDLTEDSTELASVAADGAQYPTDSFNPSISPDGTAVAYLARQAAGTFYDIAVRDLAAAGSRIVTVAPDGTRGDHHSFSARMADHGRGAFAGYASNLSPQDRNGASDVFAFGLPAAPSSDLGVTLTGSADSVAAGAPVTYTTTVTNSGPSVATDLTVTQALPAGTTVDSATASAGTCGELLAGSLTCALGTVAPDTPVTVTTVVRHATDGAQAATATVTSTTADPVPDNNTATVTTTVTPSSDLGVTLTGSPAFAVTGAPVTYTATVSNTGPSTAAEATLVQTLPAGAAVESATASAGTCGAATASSLTCTLGTVAPGTPVTVTTVVRHVLDGVKLTSATVTSTTPDPVPGNNAATATTTVVPPSEDGGAPPVPSPTPTATPTPSPSVPPTSGSTGDTATEADPAQGSVTSPAGGTVAIATEPVDNRAPAGFRLLAAQFQISAPQARPEDPLVMEFRLHTSLLLDGEDPADVAVLRNSVPVGECFGSTVADPDPCLTSRELVGDELVLRVLTSRASEWNFTASATEPAPDPDPDPQPEPAPAGCDEAPMARFADVSATSTHRDAIDCAAFLSIARGLTATTYGPERAVTRAQMAAFLARTVRAAGGSLPAGPDSFGDDDTDVHSADIDALAAAGIVQGKGPRRYDPTATVSRDQMATFLVRAYEHLAGTALPAGPDAFADDALSVHSANIDKAAAAGLTQGTGPREFQPTAPVRRDQMATFLTRLHTHASRAS